MITWWPNPISPVGIDHWYEEDGKIFHVLNNGKIEEVLIFGSGLLLFSVKKGQIIMRDLPKSVAKQLANNRRIKRGR